MSALAHGRTHAVVVTLALSASALGCREAPALPQNQEASARASSTSRPPKTVSIATYNVFYGNAEKKDGPPETWADAATLQAARELASADVIAFQETNPAWAAALSGALASTHPHCVFHDPVRYLPGGLGICAKAPIVEDRLIDSPVGWFPAESAIIELEGIRIRLVNVHLRPAVANVAEWWQTNKATRAERATEIRAYLASAGGPLDLLVGDYNDITGSDLFAELAAAGMDSAFALKPSGKATWRWAGTDLQAELDHVAFSKSRFRLVDIRVVRAGQSDHDPVIATLEGAI
ncbi:MAG: endonuclease/exonuclease/phosphatase family protein [Polyangiaceae bacterium]